MSFPRRRSAVWDNLEQSFSFQTRGYAPNVIASCRRGDPEKSLEFIIFNILPLRFCWIASPADRNDVWFKPLFNQQKGCPMNLFRTALELDSGSKKCWYFLTNHHFAEIPKSISTNLVQDDHIGPEFSAFSLQKAGP